MAVYVNPFRKGIKREIYSKLEDGLPKPRAELMTCLGDELSSPKTLYVHVCQMRQVLHAMGLTIAVVQLSGVNHYQMVKYVPLSLIPMHSVGT